jgi:pilus assembly protein Flp/PilA
MCGEAKYQAVLMYYRIVKLTQVLGNRLAISFRLTIINRNSLNDQGNPKERRKMVMLFAPKEKGQGLVEYALILVLVAIVVIAALMILGPIIGNTFSTINNSLTGV